MWLILTVMSEQLLSSLAEHGILGVILALCIYALKKERDETKVANDRARKAEESRTEDAQKVASMLLDQNEKSNSTLSALTKAIEGQQHATRAIEQEVRAIVSLARSK